MAGGGAGEPTSKPEVPEQGYGAALSVSDVDGLKRSLEDFAVHALIPHLEMRVRSLSQQVDLASYGVIFMYALPASLPAHYSQSVAVLSRCPTFTLSMSDEAMPDC